MDYVPFTLFFMVCLLSFQENVLGKPTSEADYNKEPWAQKCKDELDVKNYCTQKLIGHGYPSVKELTQLYHDNIDKFDLQSQMNETGDRDGARDICRHYTYVVDNISMIRDQNGNSRYTMYIPGVYKISIPIQECKPEANIMLDREYTENNIKCVQKSFQYPFIVLSHDKKSLELVKIKGLNSSCDLVQNENWY